MSVFTFLGHAPRQQRSQPPRGDPEHRDALRSRRLPVARDGCERSLAVYSVRS